MHIIKIAFRAIACMLSSMIRALFSLMVAFCLVATPLMIERADAHDAMGMDAIHHSAESDSHSDQDTNDPLHQAHHCCGHATSLSSSSTNILHFLAISMENKLAFGANPFGSTYQPGPLLEPPSHV